MDLSLRVVKLVAGMVADDVPAVGDHTRRCSKAARATSESEAPRRLYDGVFTTDLFHFSEANFLDEIGHRVQEIPSNPFDLIVSTDVLCYFSPIDEILKICFDRLVMGGDIIRPLQLGSMVHCGALPWLGILFRRGLVSSSYSTHRVATISVCIANSKAHSHYRCHWSYQPISNNPL